MLFDFADETGMTLFGTSAKFIDALAKAGAQPRTTHSLDSVRTMTSTGSPLAPAVYMSGALALGVCCMFALRETAPAKTEG